ncbi:hypothetical protein [Wenzhouxiangella sp. EGI_FJ10409]|uniref:hypothetical protein n=1 Tax=Wenzhouxiangella sp. EGI_FJ10409 TaxID=3243767 RepID=UPI0035DB81E1
MDKQAKVQISLRDGVLELEGSEGFVSQQLSVLQPLIENAFKQAPPQNIPVSPTEFPGSSSSTPSSGDKAHKGFEAYENLLAEADGKIQILKTLPGGNKAQKTVNAALLLAFGNHLMGNDSTAFSDVRDLCKAHACLDSGNFAATMKSQKEWFLISGSGSGQSFKLTVPGRKKAEELANQLN